MLLLLFYANIIPMTIQGLIVISDQTEMPRSTTRIKGPLAFRLTMNFRVIFGVRTPFRYEYYLKFRNDWLMLLRVYILYQPVHSSIPNDALIKGKKNPLEFII